MTCFIDNDITIYKYLQNILFSLVNDLFVLYMFEKTKNIDSSRSCPFHAMPSSSDDAVSIRSTGAGAEG